MPTIMFVMQAFWVGVFVAPDTTTANNYTVQITVTTAGTATDASKAVDETTFTASLTVTVNDFTLPATSARYIYIRLQIMTTFPFLQIQATTMASLERLQTAT